MDWKKLYPPYTWRYAVQRHFQRTHPSAPVIVANAIVLLNAWLRPSDVGFEWGSGQSTVWLASKVAHLTSVEHDADWHAEIRRRLVDKALADKVVYHLVPAQGSQMAEPRNHAYAAVIDRLADSSLDFVIVDGQMRLRCLENALEKVKPGGLLVLDGANRYIPNTFERGHTTIMVFRDTPLSEEWETVMKMLQNWRWIHTTDGLWDTRMWVKPGPTHISE